MVQVGTVALLGAGVIGAGWAGRFVLNGIDVVVYDPDPEARRKVHEALENADRAYRRLTLAPLHPRGTVRFADRVDEAVAGAEFVQESAPEGEALKREVLASASRIAGPNVIIASSTSGLLPSRLQAECRAPERVVVAHPFNPVYLLPLVELCAGEHTSDETVERAAAFYRSLGMHPLRVRHEIDGFIADRLMEALWREALHLVNDGVATADEIDQAVCYGPGLRWSCMGTFLIYRLAGGEAGMRHFMAQFGPALKLPWSRLEAPELTEALIDRIVEQSDAQARGASVRELERRRDDCLVGVLQALRNHDYAAGAVLARFEEGQYERLHDTVMSAHDDLSRPLRLHEAKVESDWVDYNGHMTESRYLHVFGDASDGLFRYVGIDADYRAAGFSYYTVETHMMNLREVAAEEPLYVTTQLLELGDKRMRLFHSLHHGRDDTQLATAEQMLIHVDTRAGRACPAQPAVLERLRRIAEVHAALPRPAYAGRHLGAPRS
ncbi:MAG: carnitine 3-dehydrogenase [Gammaproteobacteria bacterium]|nr:carnitine 3-dehydrogenase [Gammaproteobacteria bacterium]NIR58733.1 carnitine 3-dehydrogenase [Gammaproteobacteria bacterium]NIR88587.1 carnitine 3-dehydrogenase [Gammaproteobacteria bacterium]